jgi:hypothetical protein
MVRRAVSIHPIASMSPPIRWLTYGLWALPAVLLALALWIPFPANLSAVGMTALMVGVYLFVLLYYRPVRFEVRPDRLRIVWPFETRDISRGGVTRVVQLADRLRFDDELGTAIRIGAGGFYGGFGWLWTSKRGLVSFYISRLDGFVLVESRTHRPHIFTPERPAELVAALLDDRSR